jgi:hypothetical protein
MSFWIQSANLLITFGLIITTLILWLTVRDHDQSMRDIRRVVHEMQMEQVREQFGIRHNGDSIMDGQHPLVLEDPFPSAWEGRRHKPFPTSTDEFLARLRGQYRVRARGRTGPSRLISLFHTEREEFNPKSDPMDV